MEPTGAHAFDKLRGPASTDFISSTLSLNPAYNEYLKIHKVLVGPATATKLEHIYASLRDETLPRFLSVAGWAAAEAALAQPDKSATYRSGLLDETSKCWTTGLENQLQWEQSEQRSMTECSASYRYALDLAHLPLLQAMVSGNITDKVRQAVTLDVLNIAEANIIQLSLAKASGSDEAIGDHVGIGHECNALLAFHSLDSASLIAIPSSARADSGHHHPNQTHDLLVIQQKWGSIQDMTPIEVKSRVSQIDRHRYKALLVRGKMHLSVVGSYSPEHTLKAFSALFNGNQTRQEHFTTEYVRATMLDLYWNYKKGDMLSGFASDNSACRYRDASAVHAAYPEIAPNKINQTA